MITVYLRNRSLIGLHMVNDKGKHLPLSGATLRAACNGSVSNGLRKALGVYRDPIKIVDQRNLHDGQHEGGWLEPARGGLA